MRIHAIDLLSAPDCESCSLVPARRRVTFPDGAPFYVCTPCSVVASVLSDSESRLYPSCESSVTL